LITRYSEEEYQSEVDSIRELIKAARLNIKYFRGRHFNETREKALIYCLQRATDIAESTLKLSSTNLIGALSLLDRGMME
jgi:hypothetical protein